MYEIFEHLLEEKGVTVYQVAKATGISTASFTGWKQGKWKFKTDKLEKIAEYFGVSVGYLMGKELEKTSDEGNVYYLDDDTAKAAQEIFNNKDMRLLFDAAKDSRPEDLQMAADLLKRLKGTNPDG